MDVLTIIGPRQSGKTTLVRLLFSDFDYRRLKTRMKEHWQRMTP